VIRIYELDKLTLAIPVCLKYDVTLYINIYNVANTRAGYREGTTATEAQL